MLSRGQTVEVRRVATVRGLYPFPSGLHPPIRSWEVPASLALTITPAPLPPSPPSGRCPSRPTPRFPLSATLAANEAIERTARRGARAAAGFGEAGLPVHPALRDELVAGHPGATPTARSRGPRAARRRGRLLDPAGPPHRARTRSSAGPGSKALLFGLLAGHRRRRRRAAGPAGSATRRRPAWPAPADMAALRGPGRRAGSGRARLGRAAARAAGRRTGPLGAS